MRLRISAFGNSVLRCTILGSAIVVLLGIAGCGSAGPAKYPISGKVTFDGKPVSKGHIVLSPVDGTVAPDAGEIIDGSFSFMAQQGSKRVEIRATKPASAIDPVMNVVESIPYIPTRYNSESKLTIEVSSAAKNSFDFALQSEEVQ